MKLKKKSEENKEQIRNPAQLRPPAPPSSFDESEEKNKEPQGVPVSELPEWARWEEQYKIALTVSKNLSELLEYQREMLQQLRDLNAEVKNG